MAPDARRRALCWDASRVTRCHSLRRAACTVALTLLPFAAAGAELRMVAPIIPPHFDEQGQGRVGDVIRASLARCGHHVDFTMVPFGRHWKDYQDTTDFDGLATAEADQEFRGFSTRPFMHLQDGATVLARAPLKDITSVAELHARHVVAFPSARQILGIEAEVARFASYQERSNRFDQIRPLFAGRVDAILADGLITAHFIGEVWRNAALGREPDIDSSQPVVFRRIFPSGPQRLYFRDAGMAGDFDRCFAALLASGEVARIAKPYVDKYRAIVGDQYPDY